MSSAPGSSTARKAKAPAGFPAAGKPAAATAEVSGPLLSTKEAAARLRLTARRVSQLVAAGKLAAVRRTGGRAYLIPESAVRESLKTV